MILARGRRIRGSFGGRQSGRVRSSPSGLVPGRLGGPVERIRERRAAGRRDEWSLPALACVRRALDDEFVRRLLDMKELLLLFSSVLWLAAGGIALLVGAELPARVLWTLGTIEGLVLSVVWIVAAVRRRQLSVDVIALLALAGALWVNEPFAGAMITAMLISGQLLAARAAARARRELSLLVERAPRTGKRRIDGGVAEVSVDIVVPGDRLLVGTGEVVPVDGRLLSSAVLDESALTGESLPVERVPGDVVRSGVVNAGGPIELVATAAAAESTYAGIVRLVAQAQASSAPFVRMADRISLDQVSAHVLANSIVAAGSRRGLALEMPEQVREVHGYGVEGVVSGHKIHLGKASWIVGEHQPGWVRQVRRRADLDGSLTIFCAIDGRPAGAFLLEDPIRPDAPRMVRALREAGVTLVVLVTGDRADTANMVGRIVGVDTVLADCDPADKLAAIQTESARSATIMVGDGINDAPALAAAGVGVALSARGATASSEAADVVLTVDRLAALADAIFIARRSKTVALQAVGTGMGLSIAAMVAAAAGLLPPALGAILQEVIDVLAILIALRAVLPGKVHTIAMPPEDVATVLRIREQHDALLPVVEQIRGVADGLSTQNADLTPAFDIFEHLERELLPHERADEEVLIPIVNRALSSDATAALSRTHAEIEHQVSRLRRLLTGLDNDNVQPEDVVELRRLLYGLYAVLRLHNAQEEEGAFSLVPAPTPTATFTTPSGASTHA